MFYKNALRQTIEHSMDVLFSDVQESSFMENYAVARFFFSRRKSNIKVWILKY